MSISLFTPKARMRQSQSRGMGLDLMVRMAPAASSGAFSIIETINAPGIGPPRHKHREAEIFRVLEGRYLYETDGWRFYAEVGDVVSIPGGAEHEFVNVTDKPARQYILFFPALDAAGFSSELTDVMRNGVPDKAALNRSAPSGGWNFSGRL
jgi:quercetin dioxygenase-like cupin family protein